MGNSEDQVEKRRGGTKSFFLQEKPTDMIVILKKKNNSYAGELSEEANTTYSHAVKVMNRMKEAGLVQCTKKGRKKQYTLTEKGRTVAESLQSMMDDIEGMNCPEVEDEDEKLHL